MRDIASAIVCGALSICTMLALMAIFVSWGCNKIGDELRAIRNNLEVIADVMRNRQ